MKIGACCLRISCNCMAATLLLSDVPDMAVFVALGDSSFHQGILIFADGTAKRSIIVCNSIIFVLILFVIFLVYLVVHCSNNDQSCRRRGLAPGRSRIERAADRKTPPQHDIKKTRTHRTLQTDPCRVLSRNTNTNTNANANTNTYTNANTNEQITHTPRTGNWPPKTSSTTPSPRSLWWKRVSCCTASGFVATSPRAGRSSSSS